MTNQQAYYFIGYLFAVERVEGRRDAIARQMESEWLDWDKIVNLGSNHLVLPIMYVKFRDNDLLQFLPEGLSEHLEMVYQLNEERNTKLLKQARELVVCLNNIEVNPIFIKGLANVFDHLYPNLGERMMLDIDFLIHPNELSKAANALKAIGYDTYKGIWFYDKSTKHYPRLTNPAQISDIEMHFSPVSAELAVDFDYQIVNSLRKSVGESLGFFVPCDEAKLRINFLHAMFDNKGYTRHQSSLRDLYDALLLSDRVDIDKFSENTMQRDQLDAYLILLHAVCGISNSSIHLATRKANTYLWIHNFKLNRPNFKYLEKRMDELIMAIMKPSLIVHRVRKMLG